MTYDEINKGDIVWSMINNAPERFEVYKKTDWKNEKISRFPSVDILREKYPRSIHSRWPEQLAKTKEELKQMIFGDGKEM